MRRLNLKNISRAAEAGVHIIAVNHSVDWIPVAHSWFTLDPRADIRAIMARSDKKFTAYAAVPNDYGMPGARISWHQGQSEKGVTFLHRMTGDGPIKCRWGLSDSPSKINTGNSAYAAFGLAWLMGATQIGFVGLDGTSTGYAYGAGRPRGSFDHLADLFASALPQISKRRVRVYNGSPRSVVTAFDRMPPVEAINHLC